MANQRAVSGSVLTNKKLTLTLLLSSTASGSVSGAKLLASEVTCDWLRVGIDASVGSNIRMEVSDLYLKGGL